MAIYFRARCGLTRRADEYIFIRHSPQFWDNVPLPAATAQGQAVKTQMDRDVVAVSIALLQQGTRDLNSRGLYDDTVTVYQTVYQTNHQVLNGAQAMVDIQTWALKIKINNDKYAWETKVGTAKLYTVSKL
ncbi:hypothetical protein Clacol_004224 [Clathrus columnatus]|uniref:Uncharacterized protein n=1 Tax=Clathrus columnatus TaxID=1419009 RepID=A0AAV5A9Z9_9AGAM|nr:hypothetical protein Clacol_004224 [Clathrus columnatus]